MEYSTKCLEAACAEIENVEREECFEETYNGDSRPWLIRDASGTKRREPLVSTMKATYECPRLEQHISVGKRKALLRQKFLAEVTEQILQERARPPPIEKYCTTHDLTYQIPGFKPSAKTYGGAASLYEKYPLYTSPTMSYWQFKYNNRNGFASSAVPLTATLDLKNPFRRNSEFSKPISEVLDGDLL